MRPLPLAVAVLAALCLAVPTGQAALTKPLPFDETIPMMRGLGANGTVTVVSGAMEADDNLARGAIGVLGVRNFTIGGIEKACWREGSGARCATGLLTVQVGARSSIGWCWPTPYAYSYEAGHVLALFADLAQSNDLNTIPINRSIVAPAIDGELQVTVVQPVNASALDESRLAAPPCQTSGAIAALDANTTLTLRKDGLVEKAFTAKDGRFLIAGRATFPTLASDSVVLPFGPSASATLRPSSASAADRGLNSSRLESMVKLLDQSGATTTTERNGTASDSIKDLPGVIKRLLNGALVQIPSGGSEVKPDIKDLTFVRFERMEATAVGSAVHWQGGAIFAIQGGHVEHTHSLVGTKWLSLPWWSWALWVVAIGVFVLRLVLGPVKRTHWDRWRWIGWVASPLTFLLVLFLVDLEVRALFGASFLSGTDGKARFYFLLIDVMFTGLLGIMAGGALGVLLRNTSLLLKQGTFMGLATPVATLLAFLFGYSYFRDYLDLIFSQVVNRLG